MTKKLPKIWKRPERFFKDFLCVHTEIKWNDARIVAREDLCTQRKFLEGIEYLRGKKRGITPSNGTMAEHLIPG